MRHRATTPTDDTRPQRGRSARLVLAAALVACSVVGLGLVGGPAWAQDNRTVTGPVVDGVRPALPAGSTVAMTPTGELAAAGTSDVPMSVLAPDGRDFLRISTRGVDLDAAHPFTYESRTPPGIATRLPAGVAPGAPERWVHVSDAASWKWFDARTWPAAVGSPSGGRPGTTQVLGAWTVPLRIGADQYTVDGRLERRQPVGALRTTVDSPPDGLSAVVAPGDRPSLILQGPPGPVVTVLGLDGEPFLRRTADGSWEADSASRTYRLGLLRDGRPVPQVSGWVPYAEAGSVSWADDRLPPPGPVLQAAYAAATPADIWRWQVTVLVDDRRDTLSGVVRFGPGPAAAGGSGSASLPLIGLGAAVLVLGAGLVLLTRRHRRLAAADFAATGSGATTSTHAGSPADSDDADLVPPREGAPLP
ncbi:hypothetical protein [Pseudonocardia endophytica]|uniref:Uncharacterized protein n=1 Tax=Pseudonocardia endophytica TaxID=401976 RepID=A0A4R1HZZ1_PSEEN|nr:hypothetical protein [Pseudonocardia endophytica]TCK26815.1 hypothetical protein EV378_2660 [Pseudonocardia endophytica]